MRASVTTTSREDKNTGPNKVKKRDPGRVIDQEDKESGDCDKTPRSALHLNVQNFYKGSDVG